MSTINFYQQIQLILLRYDNFFKIESSSASPMTATRNSLNLFLFHKVHTAHKIL